MVAHHNDTKAGFSLKTNLRRASKGSKCMKVKELCRWKTLGVIYFLQLLSVLLFSLGFFLTRSELRTEATPTAHTSAHHGVKRFNKAVIVLVDALRFDFLSPVPWPPPSVGKPCPLRPTEEGGYYGDDVTQEQMRNKFFNQVPIVCELLTSRANNSVLLKFIADPPTTTMQRIKGMMTGSLPTFIDFSRNFGSDKINEDNLANQLRLQNRNIVFMGDDTWMDLLGHHFNLAYPYPSFNVMDLDTVDNGVNEHLFKEMANKSSEWNLIIGHLLGLDHAGHRYNLHNWAIVQKLKQLDELIRNVVEMMDNDTILVVMGDHGMTSSGDHGGETKAELEAALFLHSRNKQQALTFYGPGHTPLRQSSNNKETSQFDSVAQIDLVPSLSLLLGSSIPFSNLGKVIPHLFPSEVHLTQALDANIAQISRYIDAEASLADETDPTKLKSNEERLAYLSGVADNYRKIWTTFDIPIIILGIFSMVCACCLHLCFVYFLIRQRIDHTDVYFHNLDDKIDMIKVPSEGVDSVNDGVPQGSQNCVPLGCSVNLAPGTQLTWEVALILLVSSVIPALLLSFHYPLTVAILTGATLPLTLLSMRLTVICYQVNSPNLLHLCTLAFPGFLSGAISASNSFILNEPLCLIHISNAFTLLIMFYGTRVVNYKMSSSLDAVCVALFCSFVSRNLVSHPEAPEVCDLLKPLSSLAPESAYWRVVLTSILLIVFVLLITIRKLRELQSNESGSIAAFWFCVGVPLCSGCIIAYWFLGLQPHDVYESQPALIKVLFPRMSYLIITIGFTIFVCDPIMLSMKPKSNAFAASVIDVDALQSKPASEIIPHIAKNLFLQSHSTSNAPIANGSVPNNHVQGGSKTKTAGTTQDQHHPKRTFQMSNGTAAISSSKSASQSTKGHQLKNGVIRSTNQFNCSSSTASSSRSSSHSNVTLPKTSVPASNSNNASYPGTSSEFVSSSTSVGPRRSGQSNSPSTFQVLALHSCAVLSWHLISTPVTLFLYLVAGNGPSIGLTLLLFHMRSLCHLINTAMHPHHETVGPAATTLEKDRTTSTKTSTVNQNSENNNDRFPDSASLPVRFNTNSSKAAMYDQNAAHEVGSHGRHQHHKGKVDDLEPVTIRGDVGEEKIDIGSELDPMAVAAAMGGILFAFLGSYYFYVTGHQLAIASIRFETGFIGFLGDFDSFVVPGFLVLCNTFCAQLLANVFVPMILYTHFAGAACQSQQSSSDGGSANQNATHMAEQRYSLNLIDNEEKVNRTMWIFFASCSLTYCLKLTLTMLFTTVLRYHLMAYRVFVPNLMFQIVIYAVVLISQLLVYTAHKWLLIKTKRFIKSINKSTS